MLYYIGYINENPNQWYVCRRHDYIANYLNIKFKDFRKESYRYNSEREAISCLKQIVPNLRTRKLTEDELRYNHRRTRVYYP